MGRNKVLLFFGLLLFGLLITYFATQAKLDTRTVGALLLFLVFFPTLVNPDIGLVVIIVSMLFSPEIVVGTTAATREITIRIEDIFLLVVILATFLRTAFIKDISRPFRTKLTPFFFLYIGGCILATFFASTFEYIDFGHSFLVLLKYLEYFFLFLIVKDNLKSMSQVKVFVAVFLLIALLVSLHANAAIQRYEAEGVVFFRIGPPVERITAVGEANTLGGYFVFMIALAIGFLLYIRPMVLKLALFTLIVLMFRGFLYTLSRSSYMSFLPMLLVIAVLSKRVIFVYATIACLIVATIFMPLMVRNRITQTVTAKETETGTVIEFEESPRARIESWKTVLFERFPKSPIFGFGVGRYFIDGNFFLTLNEAGLLGLILLLRLLFMAFKLSTGILKTELVRNDRFSLGLTVGFLAGFVGLLVQAIGTNTFLLIRIMEVFWFMLAIVLSLPELLQKEKELALESEESV